MAKALITDAAGLVLSADERAFFRDADPWGFIIFRRNVETPDQLRALTESMRESVGRNAPILVDQEGGRSGLGRRTGRSIRPVPTTAHSTTVIRRKDSAPPGSARA